MPGAQHAYGMQERSQRAGEELTCRRKESHKLQRFIIGRVGCRHRCEGCMAVGVITIRVPDPLVLPEAARNTQHTVSARCQHFERGPGGIVRITHLAGIV